MAARDALEWKAAEKRSGRMERKRMAKEKEMTREAIQWLTQMIAMKQKRRMEDEAVIKGEPEEEKAGEAEKADKTEEAEEDEEAEEAEEGKELVRAEKGEEPVRAENDEWQYRGGAWWFRRRGTYGWRTDAALIARMEKRSRKKTQEAEERMARKMQGLPKLVRSPEAKQRRMQKRIRGWWATNVCISTAPGQAQGLARGSEHA